MAFPPKAGCPMCGLVSSALHSQINSSSFHPSASPSNSNKPEILWRDENFTVYRERANPVSSIAHIIITFNLHVPSIYTLSSTDLPLLINVKDLGRRFLSHYITQTSINTSPSLYSPYGISSSSSSAALTKPNVDNSHIRIGFITPPFRDNKIPVTGHLHAHAYVMPADLLSWWRGVAFSSVAWYDIDDLIAEIRESSSNNRIRSADTKPRPIDHMPSAGARSGHADGRETTEIGLGSNDANIEDGLHTSQSPTDFMSPTSPSTASSIDPFIRQSTASSPESIATLVPASEIPTVTL